MEKFSINLKKENDISKDPGKYARHTIARDLEQDFDHVDPDLKEELLLNTHPEIETTYSREEVYEMDENHFSNQEKEIDIFNKLEDRKQERIIRVVGIPPLKENSPSKKDPDKLQRLNIQESIDHIKNLKERMKTEELEMEEIEKKRLEQEEEERERIRQKKQEHQEEKARKEKEWEKEVLQKNKEDEQRREKERIEKEKLKKEKQEEKERENKEFENMIQKIYYEMDIAELKKGSKAVRKIIENFLTETQDESYPTRQKIYWKLKKTEKLEIHGNDDTEKLVEYYRMSRAEKEKYNKEKEKSFISKIKNFFNKK